MGITRDTATREAATDRSDAQQQAKNNFLAYVKYGNMHDAVF
jgi:hypothetical protein